MDPKHVQQIQSGSEYGNGPSSNKWDSSPMRGELPKPYFTEIGNRWRQIFSRVSPESLDKVISLRGLLLEKCLVGDTYQQEIIVQTVHMLMFHLLARLHAAQIPYTYDFSKLSIEANAQTLLSDLVPVEQIGNERKRSILGRAIYGYEDEYRRAAGHSIFRNLTQGGDLVVLPGGKNQVSQVIVQATGIPLAKSLDRAYSFGDRYDLYGVTVNYMPNSLDSDGSPVLVEQVIAIGPAGLIEAHDPQIGTYPHVQSNIQ